MQHMQYPFQGNARFVSLYIVSQGLTKSSLYHPVRLDTSYFYTLVCLYHRRRSTHFQVLQLLLCPLRLAPLSFTSSFRLNQLQLSVYSIQNDVRQMLGCARLCSLKTVITLVQAALLSQVEGFQSASRDTHKMGVMGVYSPLQLPEDASTHNIKETRGCLASN